MKGRYRFLFFAAACLMVFSVGCHSLKVRKYEKRARAFERANPDAGELKAGVLKTTARVLKNMADWKEYISAQAPGLRPQDRQYYIARITKAEVNYLLKAASFSDLSNVSYFLAKKTLLLDPGNEDAKNQVVTYAKARGSFRQKYFTSNGTYRHNFESKTVMKQTSGYYSSSGYSRESYRNVLRPFNCVFSSAPFGSEGVKNTGLSYYFKGNATVYGRCYSNRKAGVFSGFRGGFIAQIPYGIAGVWSIKVGSVSAFPTDRDYFDFEIKPTETMAMQRRDIVDVTVKLLFSGYNDHKVVWERGVKRLRPDWKVFELGMSNFLWER